MDAAQTRYLHVFSLTTNEHESVPYGKDIVTFRQSISFSPDERHIYVLDTGWDLSLSPHLQISNKRTFDIPLLAYSTDGQWGYMVAHLYHPDRRDNAPNALYQINLVTHEYLSRREFRRVPENSNINAMTTSPDGKRIALATRRGIRVIDLENNRDLALLVRGWNEFNDMEMVSFSLDGRHVAGGSSLGIYVWELP